MSYPSPPPTPDTPPVVTCYRHPERRAGVRCQRCERPICPSCMSPAAVGFQCPECVHEAARRSPTYTPRNLPGLASVATYAIIAVHVAAFLGQLAMQDDDSAEVLDRCREPQRAHQPARGEVHHHDEHGAEHVQRLRQRHPQDRQQLLHRG